MAEMELESVVPGASVESTEAGVLAGVIGAHIVEETEYKVAERFFGNEFKASEAESASGRR